MPLLLYLLRDVTCFTKAVLGMRYITRMSNDCCAYVIAVFGDYYTNVTCAVLMSDVHVTIFAYLPTNAKTVFS